MIKLARYLKPYLLPLFFAIALLFAQAFCDLNLPNYMSNIVSTGIQQGGIEHASPEAISAGGYRFLRVFFSPGDRELLDANYERIIDIDATKLEPMVSKPHYVENVDLAKNCHDQHVDMIYIGSCTNGRVEDLHVAADILRGKKVAKGTRLLVIPNSTYVYKECLRDGTLLTLAEAGAMIEAPNCGPCMGVHQGIPADNEVVVATQNRNFKGRIGNPPASIHLSSPATAAARGLTGYITDPREVMD